MLEKFSIGTCGPRGFYGTTVHHLCLEKNIVDKYKHFYDCEIDALCYSNNTTGLISTICAFVKPKHNVFCIEFSHPMIYRGIKQSKAQAHFLPHDFLKKPLETSILNLEFKIFVLSAIFIPIEHVKYLKEQGFRIIYVCEDLNDIDDNSFLNYIDVLLVFLPFNGAFVIAQKYIVDYMRLSANAYVFSASLPVFLIERNLQHLETFERNVFEFNLHNSKIISRTDTTYLILKLENDSFEKLNKKYTLETWHIKDDYVIIKIYISKHTTKEDIKILCKL